MHQFVFKIPTEDVCISLMSFISHHTGLTNEYISFHVKVSNILSCLLRIMIFWRVLQWF